MKRCMIKALFAAALFYSISGSFADEWDDFDTGESFASGISVSGSAEAGGRIYTDQRKDGDSGDFYSLKDMSTEGKYAGKLNIEYSGASTQADIKIKLDNYSLNKYKEDILEELSVKAFMGNMQLEAGKLKAVWGKGDKVHVIDNFNANDYTDFIYPDYVDRRIAEPMLRMNYLAPAGVQLEGIYTPVMTCDRLAADGIWQPAKTKKLTETVTGIVLHNLGTVPEAKDLVNAASFSAENLVEDNLHSLKYGQAGVRSTFTVKGIDLGASYYYGHYKQPSVNLEKYVNSVQAYGASWMNENQAALATAMVKKQTAPQTLTEEEVKLLISAAELKEDPAAFYLKNAKELAPLPSLNYDQVQVFGLEAAFVLWRFNIRAEGAYYLTEDTAGDNPWVQNNSIQWVAGFDMDMPWTNMNLNLQTQGKYILNNDKITDGKFSAYDVNYNSDGKYSSNKIIVDITDSYFNETLKIDLKGIYEVETKDFVIMPSVIVKAADDFKITAGGMWIKTDNENSEFYNFRRNSFAQVSCKYLF